MDDAESSLVEKLGAKTRFPVFGLACCSRPSRCVLLTTVIWTVRRTFSLLPVLLVARPLFGSTVFDSVYDDMLHMTGGVL
jgi:hypothetical protein